MKKDYHVNECISHLQTYGGQSISTVDLLTIILGNRDKAERLLHQDSSLFSGTKDGLSCLCGENYDSIKYMGNLTSGETAKILASLELGRRIAYASVPEPTKITCPGDAAKYFMPRLRHKSNEEFYVMTLGTKNNIIRVRQLALGSTSSAVVSPKDVVTQGLITHSSSLIISHLHPSGNPFRSQQDIELSIAIKQACDAVDLVLLDHIIVGLNTYYSMKENGEL
jgi:DNA repair protein RadC